MNLIIPFVLKMAWAWIPFLIVMVGGWIYEEIHRD